jgi:hypothetical protein
VEAAKQANLIIRADLKKLYDLTRSLKPPTKPIRVKPELVKSKMSLDGRNWEVFSHRQISGVQWHSVTTVTLHAWWHVRALVRRSHPPRLGQTK